MLGKNARPYDVFISHSSHDGEFATKLCETIEANGFKCWISSRDITAGMDWSTSITRAIEDSAVLLVIYSRNSAQSTQVPKEITLAENKGTYIIPYKIDDMPLTEYYEYHLANSHWIQYNAANGDMKMAELCAAVASVTGKAYAAKTVQPAAQPQQYAPPVQPTPVQTAPAPIPLTASEKPSAQPAKNKKLLPIIIAAVVSCAVIVLMCVLFFGGGDEKRRDDDDDDRTSVSEEYDDKRGDDETIEEAGVSGGSRPADIDVVPADITAYETNNTELLNEDLEKHYTIAGESFNTGMFMYSEQQDTYAVFNTGGKYEVLHFTVGRVDGNTNNEEVKVRISIDGEDKQIVTVKQHALPQIIDVDVRGAQQVKFSVDYIYSGPVVAFTDMHFKSGAASNDSDDKSEDSAVKPADSAAAVPSQMSPYESQNVTLLDEDLEEGFKIAGERYDTGMFMNTSHQDTYTLFRTDGAYKTLRMTVGRVDGSYSNEDATVRITVDGEEVKVIKVPHFALPHTYDVDVTGAQLVKISVDYIFSGPVVSFTDVLFASDDSQLPQSEEVVLADEKADVPSQIKPFEENHCTLLDDHLETVYKVAGKSCNSGLFMESGHQDTYAQFDIGGAYSKLCFTAGRVDGNTNNEAVKLIVYADGEEKQIINISHFALPRSYTVDVAGVSHVRIAVEYVFSGPVIALTDVCFVTDDSQIPQPEEIKPADESSVVPVDVQPFESQNCTLYSNDLERVAKTGGVKYNTGVIFQACHQDTYAMFNLNGAYKTLGFNVGRIDGNNNNENIKIRLFLDGDEKKVITLPHFGLSQYHTIDVTDVKLLTIKVDYSFQAADVLLSDVILAVKDEDLPVAETPELLTEPAVIPTDFAPYEYNDAEVLDNDLGISYNVCGQKVNNGIFFNTSRQNSYAQFNLNGTCNTLTFTVARTENGGDSKDNVTLHVFVDGDEKKLITLPAGGDPQLITIDVAGAKHLRFAADYSFNNQNIAVYDASFDA